MEDRLDLTQQCAYVCYDNEKHCFFQCKHHGRVYVATGKEQFKIMLPEELNIALKKGEPYPMHEVPVVVLCEHHAGSLPIHTGAETPMSSHDQASLFL